MPKDGPVESDEEKLRKAEAEKKKLETLSDSYDLDQEELKKKIEAERIKRENTKDALDDQLEKAYETLRARESHMVMELMNTKREIPKKKEFLDKLEKIPLESQKLTAAQKKDLKQWHIDVLAYLNYIDENDHNYDLKLEYIRLIKEDRERILTLRKEQIMRGIKVEEMAVNS